MITSEPPLTPSAVRLRDALRLDLEDEQKSLIEEVYHESHRLLSRVRVPDAVEQALSTTEFSGELGDVCAGARRLREVNQALERLSQGVYGRCERCGDSMPLSLLAHDTTRHLCRSCDPEAAAQPAAVVEVTR